MTLSHLSDSALLADTKALARKERELLRDVLQHLREIERRRLYSALRYKSLHEYAVKELGYADDAAYRRINAMRLIKELPQLEASIAEGSLNLSTINAATKVFRAEAKSAGEKVEPARKLDIMTSIENKSIREAEAVLHEVTVAPKELLKPEKIKVMDEYVDFSFRAKRSLEEKSRRIKDILSHSHPHLSTAELFEMLCTEFLARHEKSQQPRKLSRPDPAEKSLPPRNSVSHEVSEVSTQAEAFRSLGSDEDSAQLKLASVPSKSPRLSDGESTQNSVSNAMIIQKVAKGGSAVAKFKRKYISVHVKRQIRKNSDHRCNGCGSRRFLEIDHIVPLAQGGSDDPTNLRLLCRPCNQRAAIQKLGQSKMQRYLDPGLVR